MPRLIHRRFAATWIGFFCLVLAGCRGTGGSEHPVHWSYEGATGPEHWGSLSPEYALCSTGRRQSPIDIGATQSEELRNIAFHYEAVPVEIWNNGHTIQVNTAAGSFIELGGERFDLLQFHFHSPSEHRVRGRAAAAEMHLVHRSASGSLAVVGVLIEAGAHNPRFDPVWKNLPAAPGPAKRVAATIDADDLMPVDPRTLRYEGSLTTPPGTEGVRWSLMIQPVEISEEQIAAFRRIIDGNNRPIQPLNGRVVLEDSSR